MQWVPEYLRKNVTESNDNQTLYIDLPRNEQISFLQVEASAQYAATSITTTTLMDAITKYEVIADGSKVLYSLEPELAYYVDFVTHDGLLPPMGFSQGPSYRDTHLFIIPFGRHEFDEQYLLDTSLYNSVQLRIEYDVSDTAVFTAGTFRTNILMYRPLTKLSPQGFIRSRTVRKETSNTAVETITHDLPTTYPLRYVACRFEDQDQNISTVLTGIKVNIDEGRLILADMNDNEWRDADNRRYPQKNYYKCFAARSNQTLVSSYMDYPVPRAIVSSASLNLILKLYWAIGERLALTIAASDDSTPGGDHAIDCYVSGANPHSCLTIIDGREQPFNPTGYSQGKVEYALAAYETILHTFVQEVVLGKLA